MYGGLGLIANLNPYEEVQPMVFPDLPYKWSLNITGAAGAQNADLADDHKFFISTFHVGGVYTATNWYGAGLGMDVFFNDAVSNDTERGLFCKSHNYSNADKIRVGLSLNNEFRFGLKYRIWDNMYLQALAKTHRHIAEYIEFGVGYQIPFLCKDRRSEDSGRIFHHRRDWWMD